MVNITIRWLEHPWGTKLASSYANVFMSNLEDKYVYPYIDQPLLWKRFIDDIFPIWTH